MKKFITLIILIFISLLLVSCTNTISIKRDISTSTNFKYEYIIEVPWYSCNYSSTLFFTDKLFDEEDQVVSKKELIEGDYDKIIILSNKEYFKE